jgi:hypothetical protein
MTSATMWKFASLLTAFTGMFVIGCKEKPESCDPTDPNACGPGEYCAGEGSEGVCEELAACDADDPDACPAGFVCRPGADGAVCEPEASAGRIPSCIDSEGIDVFAVEASQSLSVSWNVNADLDFAGGFRVSFGSEAGAYTGNVAAPADAREATVSPLENGVPVFVVVEALSSANEVTFTSCEVEALPHVLVFQDDVIVNDVTEGNQRRPALASNLEGDRLYLVWDDEGAIAMAQSGDFGDTWSPSVAVAAGTGQANPAIAVRSSVFDDDGSVVTPEHVFIAWDEGGSIMLDRYVPDDKEFGAPVMIGSGTNPDLAIGPDGIHIAFIDGDTVFHAVSGDGGGSFSTPVAINGASTMPGAPSVASNSFTDDVYVGWDAFLGEGNTDIYLSTSADAGQSFGPVTRVDDDQMGLNQLGVSVALDDRSQVLYAAWEDRRGGANVFFSWSEDHGVTWVPNVDVGAGLGGDQFHPDAVVDIAHNVYVAFQDTTAGSRVVFSRFNVDGTFDPPLETSTAAGAGGVVADFPSVATDRYGAVYVVWEENRGGPDTDIIFARGE